MSERNEHKSGSHAFLWGMIIGGILVYLLTTKNGKRILKQLSEAGIEAIENISSVEDFDEYVDDEVGDGRIGENEASENGNGGRPRRFFKGVKRKI